MATNVIMPKLGESVVEGTVTHWLKKEGETVQEMEALVEINTDKVDTEIPSPAGGTLLKVLVPEGTTVNAGTLLAVIGSADETAESVAVGPAESSQDVTQAIPRLAATQPVAGLASGRRGELGFISPVVARLAQENQVDLAQVKGSGEGGRITKKDVLAYLESHPAAQEPAPWEIPVSGELFPVPVPAQNAVQPAASQEHTQPLPRPGLKTEPTNGSSTGLPGDTLQPHGLTRKLIAERMLASQRATAPVTTVMEANLQRVAAHYAANKASLEGDAVRLTYTAYFVAACVAALKNHPLVNSSWSDAGLLLHRAINIGLAVSLGDEGLIVPVIKGADGLSLLGIARSVYDLAGRARLRQLQPDEVRGSTFTITNHGIGGSLLATPIINEPNAAILGVGAIQKRPVVIDDAIAIRPMVYLSLTFDHRILDGASADSFLAEVVKGLENWV